MELKCIDNFKIEQIDGKFYITEYLKNSKFLYLPEKTDEGFDIYGIKSLAFIDKNIEEVYIPYNYYIEENAFVACQNLKDVYFVKYYGSACFDIENYNKDIDIYSIFSECKNDICIFSGYESCKTNNSSKTLLFFCKEDYDYIDLFFNNKEYVIIDNENNYKVINFPTCRTLYIPDTYNGKKVKVDLSRSFTSFENIKILRIPVDFNITNNFPNLKLISFGLNRENIKELRLFNMKNLLSLVVPDGIEIVSKHMTDCIVYKNIINLQLPNSIKQIRADWFYDSPFYKKIKEYSDKTRKDGLIVSQNTLFGINRDRIEKLKRIDIPDNITALCRMLVGTDGLSLDKITIGKGIKEIPQQTFYLDKCESIEISDNCERIHFKAFCLGLSCKHIRIKTGIRTRQDPQCFYFRR